MSLSEYDYKAAAWVERNIEDAHDVVPGSVEFDLYVDSSYCPTCGPDNGISVTWRQKESKPASRVKALLWKNDVMYHSIETLAIGMGQLLRELVEITPKEPGE